jgi:hypothetical protein
MLARWITILALSFALVSPVLAQNVQGGAKATGSAKETETGQSGQTGAGERGTKVGPTTEAGQPPQPKTAETGVPPRGTKVAPSTNPSQSGGEKQ